MIYVLLQSYEKNHAKIESLGEENKKVLFDEYIKSYMNDFIYILQKDHKLQELESAFLEVTKIFFEDHLDSCKCVNVDNLNGVSLLNNHL